MSGVDCAMAIGYYVINYSNHGIFFWAILSLFYVQKIRRTPLLSSKHQSMHELQYKRLLSSEDD